MLWKEEYDSIEILEEKFSVIKREIIKKDTLGIKISKKIVSLIKKDKIRTEVEKFWSLKDINTHFAILLSEKYCSSLFKKLIFFRIEKVLD